MRWLPRFSLVLLASFVLGCTATDAEQSTDDPLVEMPPMVADWYGDFTIDLPTGWKVTHCEGDAPILCFSDGGRHVGVIELLDYALPDDYDHVTYLDGRVEEFVDSMRADRAIGCPHLTFEEIPAITVDVGGAPGVRHGFRLIDDESNEVERHVLYWAVHDDAHFTITAAAYAQDGCMEPLGEFTPADLGIAQPYIDAIVEQTPLPPAAHRAVDVAPLADGGHVARVVRLDAPVRVVDLELVELLSGEEALLAARADGVIGLADDLPNDFYVRAGDGAVHSVALDAASVGVFDCTRQCELAVVTLDDFLTGARGAMNGEYAVFDVAVEDGRVVSLAEIYLP